MDYEDAVTYINNKYDVQLDGLKHIITYLKSDDAANVPDSVVITCLREWEKGTDILYKILRDGGDTRTSALGLILCMPYKTRRILINSVSIRRNTKAGY